MGRKAKPIELKVKEGNPGKQRLPSGIPTPPGHMPDIPAHLDEYGRQEWERIADGLNVMGILREVDQNILGAYCASYSRWRHAEEYLNKLKKESPLSALVLKTVSGNYIQQPLIGIANTAARDMVKYASEFGLTPAARASLGIKNDPRGKSKFDGLIGIKGGKK
jgi:P27 family predicted phage terminase small subunit